MFSRYFVVFSVLLFAGCASEPTAPNPGLKESFHTEVFANGAKRFTYALEMAAPQLRGPYTREPSMNNGMRGTEMMRSQRGPKALDLDYALALKLKETRFCRGGFFVIDRVESRLGGEIRGECRDGAER